MSHDYNGDFDVLQDKLTKKGITVDQLDIKDYIGLTENELNYIIDHAENFIKKSSSDKMQILYNFKNLKRPDNFSDESFLNILLTTEFHTEVDSCKWVYQFPIGYLWIWEELQKINIDEYIDIFNHVISDYNKRDSSLVITGHSKFDDRYNSSRKYQIFAGIAELYISKIYMNNQIFRDMLYDEYMKKFSE